MQLLSLCSSRAAEGVPRRLVLTVLFTALSGFLFGYDLCIVTDALDPMASHFGLTTAQKEVWWGVVQGPWARPLRVRGPAGSPEGARVLPVHPVLWNE